MARVTVYLVDKSAWERARRDPVARADLSDLVSAGHLLAGSHLSALEMAYSARNSDDHARIIARQRATRWLPVTETVMDRALEIAAGLALRGWHRTPIPDIIIAATAEQHQAVVLHVDKDYDRIAELTGQPTRRLRTGG